MDWLKGVSLLSTDTLCVVTNEPRASLRSHGFNPLRIYYLNLELKLNSYWITRRKSIQIYDESGLCWLAYVVDSHTQPKSWSVSKGVLGYHYEAMMDESLAANVRIPLSHKYS